MLEGDGLSFVGEGNVCFQGPRSEFGGVGHVTGVVPFQTVSNIVGDACVISFGKRQTPQHVDAFHAGAPPAYAAKNGFGAANWWAVQGSNL